MILKKRFESDELLILRYLNRRIKLNEKDKFRYLNLEKGFEGEIKFDQLIENIQEERLILNDLLLEVNNSYFQIDTLIISQGIIYLIDIKNFEGDCYMESDKIFSVKTRWEYKNPINQLKRSETLFSQLLRILKCNYLVESTAIFINPHFTLYQASMDNSIILPSQVNRFISNLNNVPSKLTNSDKQLAKKLLSLHHPKTPFSLPPSYHYDQLQKGVYCNKCISYYMSIEKYNFVCGNCGEREKISKVILRHINEFKLLLPGQKITTKIISEWCNTELNRRTICRVLKNNFEAVGKTKETYYR
ncbi:nuclease-related domain-containing protein [Evansella cellulosilytica]|uniref:NERD domain protein n=1 Tax=Evansella cellulosilytica (strain ATCC 21833 / DSM 2522 / FERM P-1141 / JCM 9156 / N-4) TaxID=649639 RepID=E6TZ41_EVAC2|nr:nuclease-related domain-containing protein [Evansella cellulosilytica]ADU32484.1 NERD domain protein [Evansella cellulosilytica DSM 2522]